MQRWQITEEEASKSEPALLSTSLLLITLGIVAVVYVALALTPSHYGMALKFLGIPDGGPIFGEPKGIRGDEYVIMTPLFQIAVLGGLGVDDVISPYGGSLKNFWPLPIGDWSLLFKPQLWSFWVLPPGYAFSAYFCFLWVAFLTGYAILFRQLGATLALAVLGAIGLLSSHHVQAWWTQNAGTYAFVAWPLVMFLLPVKWYVKLPLLTYAATVWLLAELYPPFIFAAAFVLVTAVIAFRRDALTPGNLVVGACATAVALILVWIYFGDLVQTMQQTLYPGVRRSSGGGVPGTMMLAHLFPYFTTSQFESLRRGINDCEIAVVATLLPLMFLFFARVPDAWRYLRADIIRTFVLVAALSLMLAWLLLPVPASLGSVFLWNFVPPFRMLWGFGLLLTLCVVVVSSSIAWSFTPVRFAGFACAVLGAWLLSKFGFSFLNGQSVGEAAKLAARSWFDWVVLVPTAAVGLLWLRYRAWASSHSRSLLFAASAASGVITFGTFNPIQPAHEIFRVQHSARAKEWSAQAAANPNGWLVLPGSYGAVINGAGVKAINHTLIVPQLAFFRMIFPDIPEDKFNRIFNRVSHIVPDASITEPFASEHNTVSVPMAPFQSRVNQRVR